MSATPLNELFEVLTKNLELPKISAELLELVLSTHTAIENWGGQKGTYNVIIDNYKGGLETWSNVQHDEAAKIYNKLFSRNGYQLNILLTSQTKVKEDIINGNTLINVTRLALGDILKSADNVDIVIIIGDRNYETPQLCNRGINTLKSTKLILASQDTFTKQSMLLKLARQRCIDTGETQYNSVTCSNSHWHEIGGSGLRMLSNIDTQSMVRQPVFVANELQIKQMINAQLFIPSYNLVGTTIRHNDKRLVILEPLYAIDVDTKSLYALLDDVYELDIQPQHTHRLEKELEKLKLNTFHDVDQAKAPLFMNLQAATAVLMELNETRIAILSEISRRSLGEEHCDDLVTLFARYPFAYHYPSTSETNAYLKLASLQDTDNPFSKIASSELLAKDHHGIYLFVGLLINAKTEKETQEILKQLRTACKSEEAYQKVITERFYDGTTAVDYIATV